MITIQNISKSYDAVQAVDRVSFTINKGEIFGLLGPNGAGKSTTINSISTLLKQDEGEIFIKGFNTLKEKDKCKKIIGIVPQEIALYNNLSAKENLLFWGSLYDIPKKMLHNNVNEILKKVGLFDRKDENISSFSGGMKRRINIAASLLHNPDVLLMDEPTVGVDPQSRNHIFELIEQLNKEGMTILYTTHYMEEAERLCDRIAIMDSGTIIAQGTIDELKEQSACKDLVHVSYDIQNSFNADIDDRIFLNEYKENTLSFFSEDMITVLPMVLEMINNKGGNVNSIETQEANLESVFLKLTGKQLRD